MSCIILPVLHADLDLSMLKSEWIHLHFFFNLRNTGTKVNFFKYKIHAQSGFPYKNKLTKRILLTTRRDFELFIYTQNLWRSVRFSAEGVGSQKKTFFRASSCELYSPTAT
jgi:hypothetical protein